MQYSRSLGILSDVRHIELDIDNQTLLNECKRGDRDAMSILYTRFAPRMIHVISRYVNDRDSAQDILHDGFIAALTRLDSLREAERLELWLATIMKNLSLKYLQAQTVSSILDEIPDTIEEPEIDNILDFDTLESLIRKLPEGYQKVFRLAVLENKSHKEISEILGIAPNSSSSQLFHAKLRLRELIRDYQLRAGLISLLLLLISSGILLFYKQNNIQPSADYLSVDSTSKTQTSSPANQSVSAKENESESAPTSSANAKAQGTSLASISIQPISIQPAIIPTITIPTENIEKEDSIPFIDTITNPIKNYDKDFGDYDYNDRLFADLPPNTPHDKGWSAGISVVSGMWSFNSSNINDLAYNYPFDNPGSEPNPDEDDVPSAAKISPFIEDYELPLGIGPHHHHLPISFAITAEKHFAPWFGVESGLGYSYLHTDFNGSNRSYTCHWHYIEFPLKANLYAYTSHRLKLYGSFGGRVAIPVYSYAQMAPDSQISSGTFSSKVVFSAGASIGAAFRLSKHLDLFIEPSLYYHLPKNSNIPNYWTDDEPWSISIPIGFRFNW